MNAEQKQQTRTGDKSRAKNQYRNCGQNWSPNDEQMNVAMGKKRNYCCLENQFSSIRWITLNQM